MPSCLFQSLDDSFNLKGDSPGFLFTFSEDELWETFTTVEWHEFIGLMQLYSSVCGL